MKTTVEMHLLLNWIPPCRAMAVAHPIQSIFLLCMEARYLMDIMDMHSLTPSHTLTHTLTNTPTTARKGKERRGARYNIWQCLLFIPLTRLTL